MTDREDATERAGFEPVATEAAHTEVTLGLLQGRCLWPGKNILVEQGREDRRDYVSALPLSYAVFPLQSESNQRLPIQLLMCAMCARRPGFSGTPHNKKEPWAAQRQGSSKDSMFRSLLAGTPSKRTDRLWPAIGRFGGNMRGDAYRR